MSQPCFSQCSTPKVVSCRRRPLGDSSNLATRLPSLDGKTLPRRYRFAAASNSCANSRTGSPATCPRSRRAHAQARRPSRRQRLALGGDQAKGDAAVLGWRLTGCAARSPRHHHLKRVRHPDRATPTASTRPRRVDDRPRFAAAVRWTRIPGRSVARDPVQLHRGEDPLTGKRVIDEILDALTKAPAGDATARCLSCTRRRGA